MGIFIPATYHGEMVKPYRCRYGSPAGLPIVDVLDTDEKVAAWRNR